MSQTSDQPTDSSTDADSNTDDFLQRWQAEQDAFNETAGRGVDRGAIEPDEPAE